MDPDFVILIDIFGAVNRSNQRRNGKGEGLRGGGAQFLNIFSVQKKSMARFKTSLVQTNE